MPELCLPRLYPLQRDAIFCTERYGLIEASTKAGKTLGCIVWQAAQVAAHPGEHWWVAPVYPQARIAYNRVKAMFPRELAKPNDTALTITFPRWNSIWRFRSAEKPDNLYGEDVWSAVIDEASRCREESWHAIRSTLTHTRGPVRIIGNVKGRGNWFYRLARKAQQGAEGMHYAKLTAWDAVDAGVLERDEVEDARAQLPDHVFCELYEAEPADDGGNPFGLDAIETCVRPLSKGKPIVWGWDLARSVDFTVGIALDQQGRVCRFERYQKPWTETTDQIAETIAGVPSLVDDTGVGAPITERLVRMGVPATGYRFTSASKQVLMEGLAAAIRQGAVGYPEGVIADELRLFEYEYTRTGVKYTAPPGLHDDAVCALALAVHLGREYGIGLHAAGARWEDDGWSGGGSAIDWM